MLVGRELNTRCCLYWLTVSFGSIRPWICSNVRIRMVIRDSLVGSGVRRPCLGAFPNFARKPSPLGPRGASSAECDRPRWVTVVSTLEAGVEESSSPPSFPSSPSCHYSMTSGALGSEAILYGFFLRKTDLLIPPQTASISKHWLECLSVSGYWVCQMVFDFSEGVL